MTHFEISRCKIERKGKVKCWRGKEWVAEGRNIELSKNEGKDKEVKGRSEGRRGRKALWEGIKE